VETLPIPTEAVEEAESKSKRPRLDSEPKSTAIVPASKAFKELLPLLKKELLELIDNVTVRCAEECVHVKARYLFTVGTAPFANGDMGFTGSRLRAQL
jgi:hypothetical protein